jgi:predicted amidophosphoribosyltransferase
MQAEAMLGLGRSVLQTLYPPQCLTCDALVTTDFGLCGPCWRDTPFIVGLVCDLCGTPLPGESDGHAVQCDDCLRIARPWSQGRAAMLYDQNGRKLVLALKHGDRLDLARPGGKWLFGAAQPILRPDMLVAPVPLHWLRMLKRRYNQSALLAGGLAEMAGLDHVPDLLTRIRRTPSQDHRDRDARFRNMSGALRVTTRHQARVQGRPVLLVDDVMTSGATLAAGAEALMAAGASAVSIVVLARVAKDG